MLFRSISIPFRLSCLLFNCLANRPNLVKGWWGTIGFSLFRTFPDRAELSLAPGNDFFFPNPLKPGEQRPPEWDDIVAEERGGKCIFRYR